MSDNVIQFNEKTLKQFKRYASAGVVIVGSLVILGIIISNLFVVQQNEYAVVRQFGEVRAVINEPGLHYKTPFIQSVSFLPKYNMSYDVPPAEINTADKKRILIDNYVIWKIVNPTLMIENARGSVPIIEGRLGDLVYSTIRTELGRLDYDQIINSEGSARTDFNNRITQDVNQIARTLGVEVVDVRIKRTDLPQSNEQAVFNRMISERESMAQFYLSEGDAEATKIRADADRRVQEMLATASSQALIIIGEGEQEAARIYNEAYGKDAEFYNLIRTLDSYKITLNDETVIILPISSPYAQFLMGF
jgi:membrane protease subunit HflC